MSGAYFPCNFNRNCTISKALLQMGIANISWTIPGHLHTSQPVFLEPIVHRYTQHSLQLFLRLHCPSLSPWLFAQQSEKAQNHPWAELKDMAELVTDQNLRLSYRKTSYKGSWQISLNYYTCIIPLVNTLAPIKINILLVSLIPLQSPERSIGRLNWILLLSKEEEESSEQIPQNREVFPKNWKVQMQISWKAKYSNSDSIFVATKALRKLIRNSAPWKQVKTCKLCCHSALAYVSFKYAYTLIHLHPIPARWACP